jgi:hypothetical protein
MTLKLVETGWMQIVFSNCSAYLPQIVNVIHRIQGLNILGADVRKSQVYKSCPAKIRVEANVSEQFRIGRPLLHLHITYFGIEL